MRIRRPLARPAIAPLEPLFARIRSEEGVIEGYSPDAYFEAEHGSGSGLEVEPPHVTDSRADATDIPLVTIDPVGSRDLDQALHIEPTATGHRLYYAIADVAAHVLPGGPLDRETRTRGVTVYCPDRRVGLHPPVLAEGRASLLAGQRTKAVLWILTLDSAGDLSDIEVRRAWVQSTRQYAFSELTNSPPAEALEIIALLAAVGEKRRVLARARGAVTMPRPSQEVAVADGRVALEFRAGTGIEDDNAQISLLTGEAAARLMLAGGVGILRTLPAADEGAVTRLRHQARALGVDWGPSEAYGALLQRIDLTSPRSAAFLVEATTLFRGARWEAFDDTNPSLPRPSNLTHGALAVPYAHVTAPIRRLVDRFGTEACLAIAAGRDVPTWVREALPTIGDDIVTGDRAARRVEKRCIDAVEAALVADRIGEVFTGIGLDDDTVQLADPAIVARCTGKVRAGEEQRLRLVSVEVAHGPVFATLP